MTLERSGPVEHRSCFRRPREWQRSPGETLSLAEAERGAHGRRTGSEVAAISGRRPDHSSGILRWKHSPLSQGVSVHRRSIMRNRRPLTATINPCSLTLSTRGGALQSASKS